MRRPFLTLACLAGAVACGSLLSPLPPEAVLAAAEPLAALGHPGGTYRDAAIAGSSGLACPGGDSPRWVDADIRYDRKGVTETMRVRFWVHSLEPCNITVDVLTDSGPPPILLDNALSSKAAGQEMCAGLTAADRGADGGGRAP